MSKTESPRSWVQSPSSQLRVWIRSEPTPQRAGGLRCGCTAVWIPHQRMWPSGERGGRVRRGWSWSLPEENQWNSLWKKCRYIVCSCFLYWIITITHSFCFCTVVSLFWFDVLSGFIPFFYQSAFYLIWAWIRKKLLERHLDQRPPDESLGALPTELSSHMFAVSLLVDIFVRGTSQNQYNRWLPCSQRSHPSLWCNLGSGSRGITFRGCNLFQPF